jgi:hypothetical protein
MIDLLKVEESSLVELSKTKGWYSWINLQPPQPSKLYVIGDVLVPNPGVKAMLMQKVPQGLNSTILLLDLVLIQQQGVWPQVTTWVEARYEKVVTSSSYNLVQIFFDDTPIAEIPVNEGKKGVEDIGAKHCKSLDVPSSLEISQIGNG